MIERAVNLCRGLYSPYLGIEAAAETLSTEKQRGYSRIFNIYHKNYEDSAESKFSVRFEDNSPYYVISDRISWDL